MTPLQQATFQNIVASGEIANDEQFLRLQQFFQLYSNSGNVISICSSL